MIPIPMVLAAMLNSKHMRAKGTFRSILFVPALTSVVVAGVVFRLMFGELEGSFMNQVVGLFGIDPIVWLRTPGTVWCTLFFLCLWRWTGVNMMYYLSGLQQIPADLYESASIDGATSMEHASLHYNSVLNYNNLCTYNFHFWWYGNVFRKLHVV